MKTEESALSDKEKLKKEKFDALKKKMNDRRKATEESLPDLKEEPDDQEVQKKY